MNNSGNISLSYYLALPQAISGKRIFSLPVTPKGSNQLVGVCLKKTLKRRRETHKHFYFSKSNPEQVKNVYNVGCVYQKNSLSREIGFFHSDARKQWGFDVDLYICFKSVAVSSGLFQVGMTNEQNELPWWLFN